MKLNKRILISAILVLVLAAGGAAAAGGADLAVYDGFLKGAVADGR